MNKTLTAILIAAATFVGVSGSAYAEPRPTGTTGEADWAGNQACAVFSAHDVRCYGTEAEMEAATSGDHALTEARSEDAAAAGYCNGRSDLWVSLYEFAGFGGRVLKFRDVAYWQNLANWTFSNQMTSWRNDTGCSVWAADGADGALSWLTLSANSSNSNVGATWDDRVSSIYING